MHKALEMLKKLWGGKTVHPESLVENGSIDLPHFQLRLTQTIAWCSSRINPEEPATCLRSFDLRPPGSWLLSRLDLSWEYIVNAVAQERGQWLHNFGELPIGLQSGRLLMATSITDGTEDGATEVETQGFFDIEDLPPWDTWLCYLPGDPSNPRYRHGCLVSWVPCEFIEVVEAGMEADCMDCLRWADNEDTTFTRQLREAKILN